MDCLVPPMLQVPACRHLPCLLLLATRALACCSVALPMHALPRRHLPPCPRWHQLTSRPLPPAFRPPCSLHPESGSALPAPPHPLPRAVPLLCLLLLPFLWLPPHLFPPWRRRQLPQMLPVRRRGSPPACAASAPCTCRMGWGRGHAAHSPGGSSPAGCRSCCRGAAGPQLLHLPLLPPAAGGAAAAAVASLMILLPLGLALVAGGARRCSPLLAVVRCG